MNDVLTALVARLPDLETCAAEVQASFDMLQACYRSGGKLLLCGNGGSASDCEHIVGELMKGYLVKRPLSDGERQRFAASFPEDGAYLADHLQGALPAISLVSQISLLTAYVNDVAADMMFAQQVYGYGRPGDVLLAISTSGHAANVRRAVQVARTVGISSIGLTGRSGGALSELCDIAIRVPSDETAAIQEYHIAIYHTLCEMLEKAYFQP